MNREERRREGKLLARRPGNADSAAAFVLLREAQVHHQSGRLDEAERIYCQILDRVPAQPEALHGLADARRVSARSQ